MATITTNDVQALIAFAIRNNKSGLINAMNATGNPVLSNISDDNLFTVVNNVFISKGIEGLKSILLRVPLDKNKLTEDQARNLLLKFNINTSINPNARMGWLSNIGQSIGDFLSGHSTVQQPSSSSVSSPIISGNTLIYLAVAAIILIIIVALIFRKS